MEHETGQLGRAAEIFEHACALEGEARREYLDSACAGDHDLRREVESLLRARNEQGEFLANPTNAATEMMPPVGVTEGPGSVIDQFKLLQLIGEGGFGAVYLAEERGPVVRKVALKLIKLGMDTRQVIARFEAERQALAMMDHPNIAKVLGAGATASGRPYFVMELVTGEPITAYCDRNGLSIDDRLHLFAQVCHAVQHAHQKGIIHRDIKPSNILVSTQDGRPFAKVIDFGIAKATSSGARLTDKTLFTEHRALIGTPEYMSPEQAEGSLDIDTRCDVYSLGVLLYELLTGAAPFDARRLRSAAWEEMLRIIREEEPQKPSTRLSTMDKLPSVAAQRHIEPARLTRLMRGDLDWIVMKCLEKNRSRRYETANGLAQDVERHLKNEPVLAGPPSRLYRVRKFVGRNRVMVTAATMVTAALLLGIAATTLLWRQAADAREQAREQERHTRQEADRTEVVITLINEMLQRSDLRDETGEELTFTEHLEEFAASLGERLRDQPGIEVRVRAMLGRAFRSLGAHAAAVCQFERALQLDRELGDELAPSVDLALEELSSALVRAGRIEASREVVEDSLARAQKLSREPHPGVARRLDILARVLMRASLLPEAEDSARQALAMREELFGPVDSEVGASLITLARICRASGRAPEATDYFREALARLRGSVEETHWRVRSCLLHLSSILGSQRDYGGAADLLLESAARIKAVHGRLHVDVADGLTRAVGFATYLPDRWSEFEQVAREALAIRLELLEDASLPVASSRQHLGFLLLWNGRGLPEAIALFRQSNQAYRARVDVKSRRRLANGLHHLAMALHESHGDVTEADAALVESIAIRQELDEPDRRWIMGLLLLERALNCWLQGRPLEAVALEVQAKESRKEYPLTKTAGWASHLSRVAQRLHELGEHVAAEATWREALAMRAATIPNHWTHYDAMSRLGATLVEVGRFQEAEPLLLNGYNGMKDDPRVPPPSANQGADRKREALVRIIDLYEAWDAAEPGQSYAEKAAEWRGKLETMDDDSANVPAESQAHETTEDK